MNTNLVRPVRHGDQIEVEVSSLAFGGDAVGRYKDFAIFLPGGLPGERVLAKVVQVKDHYAVAEIVSVLRPSTDRVTPGCPVFEACGGCQWQHLGYPQQLQTKRQFVVDALERIGRLTDVTVQPCLPSPNPYAYRNKALPVLSMRDGRFVPGIYEPRSHRLVPYETCPIQTDAINGLLRKVLAKIDRSGLTPYQEKKHGGFLRHLAIRHGERTGEMLLAFVTRTETPEELQHRPDLAPEGMGEILPRLARELMEEEPGLVGVLQNVNAARTNVVFGPTTRTLAGRDHFFESIDGFRLKVSLNSFLQVNTPQADLLHQVVREALGDAVDKKNWGTVLDLYSGIGTLALAVSGKADYVVGAEEVGPAVEDARENARLNGRGNIDFLEGDVARILGGLREKGLTQVDAVLIDPPRRGVLPEILSRIAAFHPERIVYVSCDPSTLARDLPLLSKNGYGVEWAQPLDMFPQTYHVETVVKLTRRTPLPPELLVREGAAPLEPFRLPKDAFEKPFNFRARMGSLGEGFLGGIGVLGRGLGAVLLFPWRVLVGVFGSLLRIPVFIGRGLRWTVLGLGRSVRAILLGALEVLRTVVFAPIGWTKELLARIRADKSVHPTSGTPAVPDVPLERPSDQEIPGTTPDVPAWHRIPGIPASTEAPAPLAAPVEAPAPSVEAVPEAPSSGTPAPPLGLPLRDRFGRGLRWAFLAVLLLGGGYWAKATLTDSHRTAMPVPVVSQVFPEVIAVMPKRNYFRYELVPFEIRVDTREMQHFPKMNAVAEVYHTGSPVPMVDGRSRLRLRRDASNSRFIGNWPIPYNPLPGTYIAKVAVTAPHWKEAKVFESAFTIAPLRSEGLYPGYSALTMEGGRQTASGLIPALDGSGRMATRNAIEWAQFMGANLFCHLMAQTSIWDEFNPRAFPFNRGDIAVGHKYAQAAHQAGMKFASYMTTFKVVGDGWEQAPYEFALGYDSKADRIVKTRFISLNDKKRHAHIVEFLKEMDKADHVDFVGMDYVRTGFGGYEMVDEFVREMSVPGPPDFWTMPLEERVRWLARTVEKRTNRSVVSLFEWWRARKVALALRHVLEESRIEKPVFTFTLGWEMGHQHGQDPAMFKDAGIDFGHIMLYEGDRRTIESMKRQWPHYLSRGNGMYAMGEMVDFNWVQRSVDPPGPEELYDRQMDIFHSWFPVNAGVGMFWHDLYRILYGIRGPYSSMEWAISGGKAFSALQRAQGILPIEVVVKAPKAAPGGAQVPLTAEIYNRSTQDLDGIVLHHLDPMKDHYVELATAGPFDLPAGNMVRVQSLYLTMPKDPAPARDNRYMAAVMVEKPGRPFRAFDFAYVKRLSPGEAMERMDVDPANP